MTPGWKDKLPLARQDDGTPILVRFQDWDCHILLQRYEQGGGPVLQLVDDEGAVAKVTVNLPGVSLAPDEILVKDYSENAGMLAALIAAGIVRDTGRRIRAEYADIPVVKLAPEILAQWRQSQIGSDGHSIG